MEGKVHSMHEITKDISKAPKDKETTTPYQLIKSGLYTDESLMVLIEILITEGNSYRAICKKLKIKLTGLSEWLSKDERYTRTKLALKISADYFADMSVQVLKDVAEDRTAIMKARELSGAYRWMARVRDVNKYGERLEGDNQGLKVVVLSLGSGTKPPEAEDTTYIDITQSDTPLGIA